MTPNVIKEACFYNALFLGYKVKVFLFCLLTASSMHSDGGRRDGTEDFAMVTFLASFPLASVVTCQTHLTPDLPPLVHEGGGRKRGTRSLTPCVKI